MQQFYVIEELIDFIQKKLDNLKETGMITSEKKFINKLWTGRNDHYRLWNRTKSGNIVSETVLWRLCNHFGYSIESHEYFTLERNKDGKPKTGTPKCWRKRKIKHKGRNDGKDKIRR